MGFLYPSFQTKLTGEELKSFSVYQRGQNWKPNKVELGVLNNPVKLRIVGRFLPGGAYMENAIPLNVKVSGPSGVMVDEVVKLYPKSGSKNAPKSSGGDGVVLLTTHTSLFSIARAGPYSVEVSGVGKVDFSLSSVSVFVLGSATVPDTTYRVPGIALMVLGGFLVVAGRKRKRRARKNDEQPVPVEPPPVKKKIRWGRNASKD